MRGTGSSPFSRHGREMMPNSRSTGREQAAAGWPPALPAVAPPPWYSPSDSLPVGRIRCIFRHRRLRSAMVTSAGSTPVSTGGTTAEMVLGLLDDFALGAYVGEAREIGRAA